MIDWTRMAKPQDDGYDSDVIVALLAPRFGWAPSNGGSFVGGRVRVVADPFNNRSEFMLNVFADVTPAEIVAVDRMLAAWPAGYGWLGTFLDEFWPKRMVRNGGLSFEGRGSCSGHQALNSWNEDFHRMAVYVTVNDPQGCAEGIYHEAGHLRLEVFGLNIDDHDGFLITNAPEELYDSPVRKDCKRPMCAVIHGLYAWMMLTESDLWCIQSGVGDSVPLKVNLPKIEEGILEVERYVRTTAAGDAFMAGLLDWAKDIVARGHVVLAGERETR